MTDQEFRTQYARMVDIYGERTEGHLREWWRIFKELSVSIFEEQVSKVICEWNPPYNRKDTWPTPGDFDYIINGPMTQERRDREWAIRVAKEEEQMREAYHNSCKESGQ